MRLVAVLIAAVALATAHVTHGMARERASEMGQEPPYAPSPSWAPIVALGYRELAADLLFVRMVGYFGSELADADRIAALAEAVTALDPHYHRVYTFGAIAMTAAGTGVDNTIHLRAIALLQRAAEVYPDDWKFPNLAGQIYLVDLKTDDPVQRRAWDEKGALLLESAARKPKAPAEAAMTAATLRTRFGQQQRAIDSLRELLLVTDDKGARERIIEQIAKLARDDADVIASELLGARKMFDARWKAERPALTPSLYVLVGPRLTPGFDLEDLATGGRDLIGTEGFERLEPVTDRPAVPAPTP